MELNLHIGHKDCPFCDIVCGAAPANVFAESGRFMAFTPLNPATEGHTLVIPKTHYRDFLDIPNDLAAGLFAYASAVGIALRGQYGPEGMNLITSAGAAATQTVFHAHVHLVPRWSNDRMGPIWPDKVA